MSNIPSKQVGPEQAPVWLGLAQPGPELSQCWSALKFDVWPAAPISGSFTGLLVYAYMSPRLSWEPDLLLKV